MHFYKFHINDYSVQTRHLSNDEDLCFRRLLDLYYTEEDKIPLDTEWVARRIQIEEATVKAVLKDFFTETPEGWSNDRADDEISEYHAVCEKNKANGKRGGRPSATQRKPKKNPLGTQRKASRTLSVISNQQSEDTPIVPTGDIGSIDLLESPEADTPLFRARALFRMRLSTPLDSSGQNAWKKNRAAVEATTEEEWDALKWYFSQGGEIAEFRTRDLSTVLSSWNKQISAAKFAQSKDPSLPKKTPARSEPEGWREALIRRYAEKFDNGMDSDNFPPTWADVPESVKASLLPA